MVGRKKVDLYAHKHCEVCETPITIEEELCEACIEIQKKVNTQLKE